MHIFSANWKPKISNQRVSQTRKQKHKEGPENWKIIKDKIVGGVGEGEKRVADVCGPSHTHAKPQLKSQWRIVEANRKTKE